MLPSELPDIGDRWCSFDCETTGLFPDAGATVTTVSVAWFEGEGIESFAFPFDQGLYGKPEWGTAYFGELREKRPILDEDGEPLRFKTGKNAGEIKTKFYTHKYTAEEVMPPDPNLPPDEWAALCAWLVNRELVGHNTLFDVILMGVGVNKPDMPGVDLLDQVVWDTLFGNVMLDPAERRALKETMARIRGGEEKDAQDAMKEWLRDHRLPVTKLGLAGWEVTEPYAKKDAAQALWLARLQWLRIRGGEAKFSRMQSHLRQMVPLVHMERRGVPFKAKESLEWADKMDVHVQELADSLPFKPTPDQARAYFFTDGFLDRLGKDGEPELAPVPCLGLDPIKMTDGGEKKEPVPAIDAEVLDTLAERDVPNARRYQHYKMVTDAVSKYYRGYAEKVGKDGRVRTRFKQFGTETYRLSCEYINLQAIPHDHRMLAGGSEILAIAPSPRGLIHPVEGYKLWTMDLAQAELRVAAQFAQCVAMLKAIEAGEDLHANTAVGLGLARGPDDPGWFKARSVIAKRANFSCIFGIGWRKFRADMRKQSGTDLGVTKVKQIIYDFRQLYPEYPDAINTHMALAEREHKIRIRDDVWRYFTEKEIRYEDFHKAFNNRVQGNIGMLTKEWMTEVDEFLLDEGVPDWAGLLLQIHDALFVMLPDNQTGEELAQECAQIGRNLWDDWFEVPGGVDLKAGV